MKRQFILSFLFIFFSQLSLCQSGNDLIDITTYQEPFIYLKDGTLLLEPDFRVKKRFLFGNSFYDANDKKIRLKDVKYFQHKNGVVAVINNTYSSREISGRYNVYVQRSESAGTYDSRGNYRNGSPTKSYFYSIGFDDVKKFKYKNLKVDLADFSGDASLEDQQRVIGILEKGKKRSRTRSTLIWSGVGVMLVGIGVSQLGKGNDEPTLIEAPTYTQNEKLGLAITAVGLGISVTGLVMKDERKFYLKAVEEYNRIYSY